jgi:hypothetical protein
MPHALYEIWEDITAYHGEEWCAQMVDYVAHFPTKRCADHYVATVREYRKKNRLK